MTEMNTLCQRCRLPLSGSPAAGICQRCLIEGVLRTREQELQDEVLQLTSASDRAAFIQGACSGDSDLCDRLLTWLAERCGDQANQAGPSQSEPALENRFPRDTTAAQLRTPSTTETIPERGGDTRAPMAHHPASIGPYRLLRLLGEGGFGEVFLAEQTEPVRRRVALKILKLGMETKQVVARFETERQALALMDHPNIAKVLDAGTAESGRPYFVMELVWGLPITEYCQQHHLSVRQRLKLFVEVCHAVQHAHQKGIIHRDLKPSNILVALQDEVATPKVIDFGIAKATQQDAGQQTTLTQLHQFVGTPAYISPEQASLSRPDIDTRSDIYSLGVLLYELLTGKTPFDSTELLAAGFEEMFRTIRQKQPIRPSKMLQRLGPARRRLPTDLDWIVLKCLHKDRTRRYATANGLAMEVQRHLDNEAVLARPPSLSYRCSRLVRRNPIVSALAALLFLSLATALWVSLSMGLRVTKAKHETDLSNRRLRETIRRLEWQKAEAFAAEGRRYRALAWFAGSLRENPNDAVAASRVVSMLTLHGFALPIAKPLVHGGPVFTAQVSPEGRQVLTASGDRTVRFWDARTGQLLRTLAEDVDVLSAAYLAEGTQFLVSTRDNVIRICDTATGAMRFAARNLHNP